MVSRETSVSSAQTTTVTLITGARSLRFETATLPSLAPGWVRVRFAFCGICGSDMSVYEGRRGIAHPESMGHEFVAEVVDVGTGVTGLRPGDTVTSDLNHRCGSCAQCVARRSHLCREGQIGLFTNRAFSQFADLHAGYLLRVEGPPALQIALSEPLSCVLHAKDWAQVRPSDRVLVIGAGGLGMCMAFGLCHEEPEVSFEITDVLSTRRSLITAALGPSGRVVEAPEGAYDVVFDLSGSESGLRAATRHVRPGGRLCTMSHLDGYGDAAFLLAALTRLDVSFKVSYLNGEWANLDRAATMLRRAWGPSWQSLVGVVSLQALPEAFAGRRDSPWCKTVVRLTDDAS